MESIWLLLPTVLHFLLRSRNIESWMGLEKICSSTRCLSGFLEADNAMPSPAEDDLCLRIQQKMNGRWQTSCPAKPSKRLDRKLFSVQFNFQPSPIRKIANGQAKAKNEKDIPETSPVKYCMPEKSMHCKSLCPNCEEDSRKG